MSICHLCLRTDRKVHTVEEQLGYMFDDLCDFAIVEQTESCSECAWTLKKFYDFREKCILAVNILKKWKSQKKNDKIPRNLLYTKLPQSGLGFSNIQNCKVFTYNEVEKINPPPINPSNPCIVINPSKSGMFSNNFKNNTDIFDDEILEDTKKNNYKTVTNDIKNDISHYDCLHEIKCENNEFGEDSETVQISEEFHMVVEDCDSKVKGDEFSDAVYVDLELLDDAELQENSLTPDDNVTNTEENCDSTNNDTKPIQALHDFEEVMIEENYTDIQEYRKSVKKIGDPKCIETKKSHTDSNHKIKPAKENNLVHPSRESKIQLLRDMLKRKFDNNAELKDQKGNVIDEKLILDCLEKLSMRLLKRITSCVTGSKTFDSADTNMFTRLQNRYKTNETEYERVFTSEVLLTEEQILEEFGKRQYDESYVGSEHKCTTCYRWFKYAKLLNYHLRTFHDKSAPLGCPLCKMRFRCQIAFYRHNNAHKLILKCKLCPFTTSYRASMINHFNFHQGVTYTCKICEMKFTSVTAMMTHKQNRHSSEVVCGSCAKNFVSPSGLKYHTRLKHADEVTDPADSVKCQTCDVTFVSKTVLELHMSRAHGYPIRKRRRRNNHATGSTSGRTTEPYVCRLCQSVGPNVGWLNKHFRYEHPNISLEEAYWMGKKYLCHVCGKTFGNVTKLDEHKVLHTGAKPYPCPQCSRGFRSSYALKAHMAVHLPKSRQCDICGKKFRSFSNLNCHRRIHSSERSYKCETCPATFLFKSALKEHVLGVHQNVGRVRVKPGKRKIQLETTRMTETEMRESNEGSDCKDRVNTKTEVIVKTE